jgi:hypothetical protein
MISVATQIAKLGPPWIQLDTEGQQLDTEQGHRKLANVMKRLSPRQGYNVADQVIAVWLRVRTCLLHDAHMGRSLTVDGVHRLEVFAGGVLQKARTIFFSVWSSRDFGIVLTLSWPA